MYEFGYAHTADDDSWNDHAHDGHVATVDTLGLLAWDEEVAS